MNKPAAYALALGVAAVVATPAFAIAPQECRIGDPARPYADVPEDLGSGLVLQRFVQGEGNEELNVSIIVFCPSSEQVEAVTMRNGQEIGTHEAVMSVVRGVMGLETAFTMSDLGSMLEAAGFPTLYQQPHASERCGCASFYPELRGNKTPWSAS